MQDEVANDNTVNAVTATNRVGALQGLGDLGNSNDYSGRNNSAYIAGLAFDSNTKDIRPDVAGQANTIGKQTVSTYWVDVLEQPFQFNNQFYLAAKFGGLDQKKLPADFDPYTFAGTIPLDWWSTSGETLTDARAANLTQPRPDNYFAAGQPDTLVRGLTQAFERIVNAIQAYTTSFSLSALQVSATGLGFICLAVRRPGLDRRGEREQHQLCHRRYALAHGGNGTAPPSSRRSSRAPAGTPTGALPPGTARQACPSASANLTTGTGSQAAALDTLYVTGDDSANYLNYLRGDRSQEKTASDGTKPYRLRSKLLGDIVNSKVKPVGPPASSLLRRGEPRLRRLQDGQGHAPDHGLRRRERRHAACVPRRTHRHQCRPRTVRLRAERPLQRPQQPGHAGRGRPGPTGQPELPAQVLRRCNTRGGRRRLRPRWRHLRGHRLRLAFAAGRRPRQGRQELLRPRRDRSRPRSPTKPSWQARCCGSSPIPTWASATARRWS